MAAPAFSRLTPASSIAEYIDTVRRTPAQRDVLVDLLAEQSPIYAGRSTNEAERLRGYVLASFEATGLPAAALEYVREELQSGRNPYTVAAAAKALRGADSVLEQVAPLLLAAIERIRPADDVVSFDSYSPADGQGPATTALTELVRTLAWLGPGAGVTAETLRSLLEGGADGFSSSVRREIKDATDVLSHAEARALRPCCAGGRHAGPFGGPAPSDTADTRPATASREGDILSLELQDQSGALLSFGELFCGRPSILTFFYTRCMNPEKCSFTITKLARLQRTIEEAGLHEGVTVAAITYDPAFDLPRRLYAYGADRGMIFDDRNRLLRTTGPFAPLRSHFDLGVGYGTATVNRHRLELFILDGRGCTTAMFTRMLWDADDVLAAARAAMS